MIYYSGHAETVGPLLTGFNQYSVDDPAPGSALFLEFSSDDANQNWVKVFYKATPTTDDKIIKIPGRLNPQDNGAVHIDDFETFIKNKLQAYKAFVKDDMQAICLESVKEKRTYSKQDRYMSKLFNHFNLKCSKC